MKNIFSVTIAIISLLALSLFSITLIDVHFQIQSAREFHSNVVNKIQSSNFNQEVIQSCILDANENDYILHISDTTIYKEARDFSVILDYSIHLLLFEDAVNSRIEGYAR